MQKSRPASSALYGGYSFCDDFGLKFIYSIQIYSSVSALYRVRFDQNSTYVYVWWSFQIYCSHHQEKLINFSLAVYRFWSEKFNCISVNIVNKDGLLHFGTSIKVFFQLQDWIWLNLVRWCWYTSWWVVIWLARMECSVLKDEMLNEIVRYS